ncbi:hypothetical protein DL769_006215 [Monosporascus sp. CRB-8-3]|nr:hypothetical protein DL769_006215 [Monosporascus sp. CRB-8-3]
MSRRLSFLPVTWLLLALSVYAQRKDGQYWLSLHNLPEGDDGVALTRPLATCPPNPGLNQYSYYIDFTDPPDDLTEYWTTSNYATITYNTKGKKNGAEFAIAKRYDAPQLYTNFYIFFGRVDVEMQVAPGRGIISSSVLMSDSFDEIDWEMSGNNFNLTARYPQGVVQNNYFSKGIVGTYDRGMWVPLADPQTTFYTYSVDWTPTRLDWLINGKVIRTFFAKDADTTTHQFPQTPAKIQLGIWAGGDPSMNEGTVRWAGGITDFSKAPFTMFAKSVRITNYNPARYYNWTNQSGNMKSIKGLNISLPDPEPPTSTSIATSLEPLRTDLPVSPNGHCGSTAKAICKDSLFGDCCSFYNYCGNTTEYCGLGCQSAFGICGPMNPIATTGVSTAPTTTTTPSPPTPIPYNCETSSIAIANQHRARQKPGDNRFTESDVTCASGLLFGPQSRDDRSLFADLEDCGSSRERKARGEHRRDLSDLRGSGSPSWLRTFWDFSPTSWLIRHSAATTGHHHQSLLTDPAGTDFPRLGRHQESAAKHCQGYHADLKGASPCHLNTTAHLVTEAYYIYVAPGLLLTPRT